MNVNPTSYKVRGDTSQAPQRSEVGESHQHVHGGIRRSHAWVSPSYSHRTRSKMTPEYQVLATNSLREKFVKRGT